MTKPVKDKSKGNTPKKKTKKISLPANFNKWNKNIIQLLWPEFQGNNSLETSNSMITINYQKIQL